MPQLLTAVIRAAHPLIAELTLFWRVRHGTVIGSILGMFMMSSLGGCEGSDITIGFDNRENSSEVRGVIISGEGDLLLLDVRDSRGVDWRGELPVQLNRSIFLDGPRNCLRSGLTVIVRGELGEALFIAASLRFTSPCP